MIIPEKIKGRHKTRDLAICLLWSEEDKTFEELAEKFKLSERRILQILRTNHLCMPIDREWEKKKAVHRAKKAIKSAPKTKKDKLEWEQHLHKLVEGNQPIIDNSTHTHIQYNWGQSEESKADNDTVHTSRIPIRDT